MPYTNETTRASIRFQNCWKEFDYLTHLPVLMLSTDCVVTGFTSFARSITIQHGTNWRWNRSLCVEDIKISDNVHISLQKFNSRTLRKGFPFPSYKVWITTIYQKSMEQPLFFVWCEKGEALHVKDLAFLKPFISPRVAADLDCHLDIFPSLHILNVNYVVSSVYVESSSDVIHYIARPDRMDESSATLRDSGVLERQDADEYVSFLREEEIYHRSTLALYIPQEASEDHEENLNQERRNNPRTSIVQGELLLCYAIFSPEAELIKQFMPVLSIHDDEETKKNKRDPIQYLRSVVKHSAFFQNIRFEISFLCLSGMTSQKVITETEPSHVPHIDPSESWTIMAQQGQTINLESNLPFYILQSGEIAFPLRFPISIKDSFEDMDVKMRVVVTPVSFPDQNQRRLDGILSYLLSSDALKQYPHQRATNLVVKLLQPLSVYSESISLNNSDYVNIFVENKSNSSIELKRLKVKENATSITPEWFQKADKYSPGHFPMPNHYSFTQQNTDLPIMLKSGDRFGFVVKVKANYEQIADPSYVIPSILLEKGVASWRVESELFLLWSNNDLCSTVISSFPMNWSSPKHEDLLVSISTPSPKLNELFNIGFTVTNLSSEVRDFKLQLNPTWSSFADRNDDDSFHSISRKAASLLCLEKSANIGALEASCSTSLNLPFIAIDEGIFQIDQMQIVDNESNSIYCLDDTCEIFVTGRS